MTDPRFAPLLPILRAAGLDAAALITGANFYRLLGAEFHLMERPLVVIIRADGAAAAIVPELEFGRFDTLGFSGEIFTWSDAEGYRDAFASAARAIGRLGRLGVEGQRMRVFEGQALEAAFPGVALVDAHSKISAIRLRKTEGEIAQLRDAIRRSETAFEATLAEVRVGMSETEIQAVLLRELFAAGVEGLSFDPIVAAGDNSYQPHAVSRPDYRVKPGDALLFDFGGRIGGMNADITRTVFIAEASGEDRAFYETVAAANAAGRAAARPGVTAGALDDAVQKVLEASPFADYRRHKTGHGLGLDVHEDPHIIRGNETALEPGMVFTIEPGLYREGRLGVRIEDDVVVTETGAESLTQSPRELRIVG